MTHHVSAFELGALEYQEITGKSFVQHTKVGPSCLAPMGQKLQ